MTLGPASYTARVLIAVAIVALAVLLWRLLDVALLVFGAIVVAVVLRALTRPLAQRTGLPSQAALVVVVLALAGLSVVGVWLIGDRVAEQFSTLRESLPRAFEGAIRWLHSHPIGLALLDLLDSAKGDGATWFRVAGLAGATLGALTGFVLMIVIGIYLAADPGLYQRGLLKLVPASHRARIDDALRAAGNGLGRWLLGQGVAMLIIGVATATGLWLLDIPLALTLGLIAGLLEFVPFFGPIASGILIVVLALMQGPQMALYAALLCFAIQQCEEYIVMPFVHRWAVKLPPVLGLVAIVMFSVLFGPLGVLLATPLIVVVMILVERLYVQGFVEASERPARRATEAARSRVE